MTAEVDPRADVGATACIAGRYELAGILGTGATAEVRAGWDRRLDRPVAVKLLRTELCDDPAVRQRFAEEARSAARLSHPSIVAVFDTGDPGMGRPPYIVMERLSGDTLRTAMQEGPLPVPEVWRLAEQMLAALQAGARVGLAHCDIKPGNILAAGPGAWKLADFGISHTLGQTCPDDTVADMVMGTPAYLAPERLCGHRATEASDLFALGVVLFEALTGTRPYQSMQSFPWSTALSGQPAPPVRALRPDVDPVLAAVVDRSIRLDPAERFARADQMAAALAGPAGEAVAVISPPRWFERSPFSVRRLLTATVAGAAALTATLLLLVAGVTARPARAGTTPPPSAHPKAPAAAAATPPATAVPAVTTVPAAVPVLSAAAHSPAPIVAARTAPRHAAGPAKPAKAATGPAGKSPAPARPAPAPGHGTAHPPHGPGPTH